MGKNKAVQSGIQAKDIDHLEQYYRVMGESSLMPLRLVGTTPLLMHAWGHKALIQMIGKMTGHEMPRENKDLTQDYEEAFYRNSVGQVVIPCRIVKRCMLNGALATKKAVTKVDIGRYFRVQGQTAPIEGTPRMDVRLGVVGRGKPNVIARPIFDEWSIEVVVRFTHALLPAEKVLLAAETAGDAVGMLEWRPSSNSPGEFGCFRVEHVEKSEIDRILEECQHPERPLEIPQAFFQAASALDKKQLPKNAQDALMGAIPTPVASKKNGRSARV